MFIYTLLLQAYLEFFTSRENVAALLEVLTDYPLVTYHVVNHNVSVEFME